MLYAAKTIKAAEVDPDWTEEIVHDVRRVFADRDWPEAIKSGDPAKALIDLPDAPWADKRKGKGLSTNGLLKLLRPFEVRSRQARGSKGKIRGYWLAP